MIQVAVNVGFMDAVNGVSKTVSYMADEQCKTCDGTGAAAGSKPVTCSTCKGSGRVCG
jgi:molecular chaperone DnaJ